MKEKYLKSPEVCSKALGKSCYYSLCREDWRRYRCRGSPGNQELGQASRLLVRMTLKGIARLEGGLVAKGKLPLKKYISLSI